MANTRPTAKRAGRGHLEVLSAPAAGEPHALHWEGPMARSYGSFTIDPEMTGARCSEQRPLPEFEEPRSLPSVTEPLEESCVPVTGDRLSVRTVYLDSGWPQAAPFVVARRGVVDRLRVAAASLPDGFGLCVLDAWRPLALQDALHAASPEGFKSKATVNPALPPPHLSGGAVDITLTWEDRALALGTAFDAFGAEAWSGAFESRPGLIRDLRRLHFWTLQQAGFVVLDREWWHFEHGTPRWAALNHTEPLYAAVAPT